MNRAVACAGAAALLLVGGCAADESGCTTEAGIEICGDVGIRAYSVEVPGAGDVQWPPVALDDGRLFIARGKAVVEIKADGEAIEVATFKGDLSVLAQAPDGSLVAVESNGNATVFAWSGKLADGKPVRNWNKALNGQPTTAPVTIGGGLVAATTLVDGIHTPNTETVTLFDPKSGKINFMIDGSKPIMMDDGSMRVVTGLRPCGSHRNLSAHNKYGSTLWTYTETQDRGIVDFSPGPGATAYIVTEQRRLRAIDSKGNVKWSFMPTCEDCTVAAAPTVTHNRLYFPVWEGGDWACQQDSWMTTYGYDPLYSLRFDGTLEWVYDGFHTTRTKFQPAGLVPLSPAGGTVAKEDTQHHPAGRPTVASDGTLYVGADGAMVTLDAKGNELGRVIMDRRLGETNKETGTANIGLSTIYDGGTQATPVLAADGRVYTFDGKTIHAFDTGRKVASVPWLAPFGGATNASNVH